MYDQLIFLYRSTVTDLLIKLKDIAELVQLCDLCAVKHTCMKKIILALLVIALAHFPAFAQPMATEGSVEYQKGYKPAAIIELPYTTDIVTKAIKDNMQKKGLKEEKIKGFQVFKGARLTPTDGEVADLYFKVDRKSRKEDNISVVYMIVGRPNENVALRSDSDPYRMSDAKSFLTDITPSVAAYDLEVNILAQEEIVKKAEKKLRNLEDDQRDYEKKIRSLEEKLAQNKRDQESQNAEVSKQRTVRDAMLSRRAVPNVVQ